MPPLCRETQSLGQQMLNAPVGINGLMHAIIGMLDAIFPAQKIYRDKNLRILIRMFNYVFKSCNITIAQSVYENTIFSNKLASFTLCLAKLYCFLCY